jgi:hypothetical protein
MLSTGFSEPALLHPFETRWGLLRQKLRLLVQDDTEEGIVNVKAAIVMNEAEVPEFIHEEVDPAARGANHLREHLLRYFGDHLLRLVLFAIARQQQQSTRQAFLA